MSEYPSPSSASGRPVSSPAARASDDPASVGASPTTGTAPARRSRRRTRLALIALAVPVLAVIASLTIPVDAVIEAPGPTWNVLGKDPATSKPVLSLKGAPTYPTDGALRMVTVSVTGCPGYPVHAADVLLAWLQEDRAVVDRDAVCPKSMSANEVDEISQAEMTSAQDAATTAALLEAGVARTVTLTVAGTAEGQTTSTLREGDVIRALRTSQGTTQITTFAQLRSLLSEIAPGTTVTLEVTREGKAASGTLTTLPPSADDVDAAGKPRTGSLLGLYLTVKADSEVTTDFTLTDVGGPSAGLVMALGVVDQLTPGDLTGGKDIAATGTIDSDGAVGPIGGIAQKMVGARKDGAAYFLAPASNCADLAGHVPQGLEVYPVSTLHEAVRTTKAIAEGHTSGLPTCSAQG